MSSKQQTISGRQYSFGTIPAVEALQIEVSIARVIGEPLFKAFMDIKVTGMTKEIAMQAGATAIGLMASKMDAEELQRDMEIVMKYVSCDGQRIPDLNFFTGRNRELWEVFFAGLRHNFSDFLPANLFDSLREMTQQ
jgi:hypothetical protein